MENEDSKSIVNTLSKAIASDKPLSDAVSELAESLKDLADSIHRFTDKIENLKYGI